VHVALRTTSATSVRVSSRETAQMPTLLLDWTGDSVNDRRPPTDREE
jgi:hypothetical protein